METKQTKLYESIISTMRSTDMNLYIVDDIVAKLSAEYERSVVSHAKIMAEVLETINEDTKIFNDEIKNAINKIVKKTTKKFTKSSVIDSKLDIDYPTHPKGKLRRNESTIKEGLFDWFKNLYFSFKGYLSKLSGNRIKLQELAHDANLI